MINTAESSGDRRNSDELNSLRKASATGLRPVTVRQLVEATRPHSQAPWSIDGVEVHEVATVAHVVRIRRYDIVTFLEIEDGTKDGRITVKRWLNEQDSDGFPTDGEPFYARFVGTLSRKGQETKNVLELKGWQRVTDPHQLFCHILEVAFVTLALERGPPSASVKRSVGPLSLDWGPSGAFPPASAPNTPAIVRTARPPATQATPAHQWTPVTPAPTPPPRTPSPPPSRSTTQSPPASPSRAPASPTPHTIRRQQNDVISPLASGSRRASGLRRDPYAHLTVLQRAILLQILNTPPSGEGVSVVAIVRGISHHDATEDQIGEALDFLMDAGYISTIGDDEHFVMKTNHYPTSS
ncbi:hypothetical protein OH77DRAFT_19500 [Trametes cingulata]|nr:hypothetical protein OH77DRAFT_19500 [Trametes cingulata]